MVGAPKAKNNGDFGALGRPPIWYLGLFDSMQAQLSLRSRHLMGMALFALIAVLLIEQIRPLPYQGLVLEPLRRLSARLESIFNAGEHHHGIVAWIVGVGGLVLAEGRAVWPVQAARSLATGAITNAKVNRDRLVPLPQATLAVLRRFWQTHRHPELLFPNRSAGLKGAQRASSPLDRGGVQLTLRKVATACGLKKRSPLTVCATAMPRT